MRRALLFAVGLLQSLWLASGVLNDLRVAFRWKQMDYEWPEGLNDSRRQAPLYQQKNNLPLGLEVAGDRLFITVPRWKHGVPATLNYVWLNDSRESPPLNPFPSWSAHESNPPEIVSTFRVRADRCNRLWVLDSGMTDALDNPEALTPPTLLVYDLTNDSLLRKYVIPETQRNAQSLFANIAVEDYACDDAYGYLGDLGGPGMVVYSWKANDSWLVKHPSFEAVPEASEFNVTGIKFEWSDGLFGMALAPGADGFSRMYYHPLSSLEEYAVNTSVLRDSRFVNDPDAQREFRRLGKRGSDGQSSVSFFDPDTGVLLYALTNLNAIACWRPQDVFSVRDQGIVYHDSVTMVFPNDLKVDRKGNVWVLSDRLPTFMYAELDPEDYNFRVFTGPVRQAINGTACQLPSRIRTTKTEVATATATASADATASTDLLDSNRIAPRIADENSAPAKASSLPLSGVVAAVLLKTYA